MLIGNVGADPEIRYLEGSNAQNSTKVASIRLATTERYRDRASGELKEITEWHRISAWGGNADVAEKYIRKGTQIYVEGRLRTRSWTDKDNNPRYSTEILADTIQLLGRKSDNPASGAAPIQPGQPSLQSVQHTAPQPSPAAPQPAPQPQPVVPAEGDDDDLPF